VPERCLCLHIQPVRAIELEMNWNEKMWAEGAKRTSISDSFWAELKELAAMHNDKIYLELFKLFRMAETYMDF
jgi:hypothetical protein